MFSLVVLLPEHLASTGPHFTVTVWNSFPLWNPRMATRFGTDHQNLGHHQLWVEYGGNFDFQSKKKQFTLTYTVQEVTGEK